MEPINQTNVETTTTLKNSPLFKEPGLYSLTPEFNNGCQVLPSGYTRFTANANDIFISGSCRSEISFQRKDKADQGVGVSVKASFKIPEEYKYSVHPFSILQIHERPPEGARWLSPPVALTIKNGILQLSYGGTELCNPTSNILLSTEGIIPVSHNEILKVELNVIWATYNTTSESGNTVLEPGWLSLTINNILPDGYHKLTNRTLHPVLLGRNNRSGVFFKNGVYSWEMARSDIRTSGIDIAQQSILVKDIEILPYPLS